MKYHLKRWSRKKIMLHHFSPKKTYIIQTKTRREEKKTIKERKTVAEAAAGIIWMTSGDLTSLTKQGWISKSATCRNHTASSTLPINGKGGIFIPSLPFLLLNSNTTQTCNLAVVAISTFQLCYRLLSTIINPFQEAKPPNKAWERKLKMKTASLGWNTCLCQTKPHVWFFIDSPSANLNIILWLMKL